MAIIIKTEHEIELMRKAGEILAKTHEKLKKIIKPGISTYEIDKCGEDFIRSCGCEPSFLNYQGYPASICVSVNDEVVHGIPSKERILQEGDIVSSMPELYTKDITRMLQERMVSGRSIPNRCN
mgnify:CR=1 FL=1